MKTIEDLKQEQYDLKAKLHEMIEFINGEEFFKLSPREKSLVGQQRSGMEVYLNALTNRIYCADDFSFDPSSAMWPMLLGSMFSSSSFGSPSSNAAEDLQKMIDEVKEKEEKGEENES